VFFGGVGGDNQPDGALVGPCLEVQVPDDQVVVRWLEVIREDVAVRHGCLGCGTPG